MVTELDGNSDGYIDASLINVADSVSGTANKITVTDNGDGTITLTLPTTIKIESLQAVDADGLLLKNDGGTTVATCEDGGMFYPNGGLKLPKKTITDVGPTDDVDVTGINYLFMNLSGGNVTIGGFIGGVDGQVLFIKTGGGANDAKLEHSEGTGNQDIYLSSGGDETVTNVGGWTLICNGSNWTEV